MIPWENLGRSTVPGAGVLELFRRGQELSIRVDGRELMNSRVHGSEDALAELALDRVGARPGLRVLIGGLGMGFTLAAALRRLPADGVVVVAELVAEVIAWNQGPIGPVAGEPLRDARVTVRNADVGLVIREAPAAWDAILLDVDNGPDGLTSAANDWLYGEAGLSAARRALRPGGVLGVWSAAPDPTFLRRFGRVGYAVDEVMVRARGAAGGARHILWFGRTPGRR